MHLLSHNNSPFSRVAWVYCWQTINDPAEAGIGDPSELIRYSTAVCRLLLY
jgi:hypothetical protein